MELKPFKVSELNQYIKRILISDPILYNVSVEGEISNFKHHYNGHMYFTIKDEQSKIKSIMFSEHCDSLDFVPKDGIEVCVFGYISVYDRDGSYQLYAKKIKRKGLGELHETFEKLKMKLKNEGLFLEDNKKNIPQMPKKIGVVTSSTGAAVRDIISTIKRRMDTIDIFVYQVMVQGKDAHLDICRGIRHFNKNENVDTIIIGRGGGSIEELWAFNEETIAREIYNSKIPIISAVGHETDFTIADFVSDIRASTPSVAAEIATPSSENIRYRNEILLDRLIINYKKLIDLKRKEIELLNRDINERSPEYKIEQFRKKISELRKSLVEKTKDKINSDKTSLEKLTSKLDALSPLSVLGRGYNIATNEEGNILKTIKDVSEGESLKIIFEDGKLSVKIISIESKVNNNE